MAAGLAVGRLLDSVPADPRHSPCHSRLVAGRRAQISRPTGLPSNSASLGLFVRHCRNFTNSSSALRIPPCLSHISQWACFKDTDAITHHSPSTVIVFHYAVAHSVWEDLWHFHHLYPAAAFDTEALPFLVPHCATPHLLTGRGHSPFPFLFSVTQILYKLEWHSPFPYLYTVTLVFLYKLEEHSPFPFLNSVTLVL